MSVGIFEHLNCLYIDLILHLTPYHLSFVSLILIQYDHTNSAVISICYIAIIQLLIPVDPRLLHVCSII